MNTTRIETGSTEAGPAGVGHAPARPRRRAAPMVAAMAGLLGCGLLALGVPRLIAGTLVADGQDVVWDLAAGRRTEPARIAGAADARAAAARWEPAAEREAERGLLLIRHAEAALPGPERERLLADAEAAIVSALSLGPVQPHAWAALAALREHAGNRPAAVQALRLSMLAGAFEPDLMLWRIDMGLRLLPLMNPETEALLRRQVRKTWVSAPDKIAKLANTPEAGPFVRRALEELSDAEIADYVRKHGRK